MTELVSPGRILSGRYRLLEPRARGGMATVWVADDPVLARRVAVKVLRADLAEDDALRARFRNEAIAAAKLSHPNIVATYDTGDDDGTAYIVMELVEGPTLRRVIDDVGPLPLRDVLRIGEQVADALDAAHRAGLVHRDVKPANVLVPETGPVKVTDFGIAKAIGSDDLTRTGMVMGTARYLAPEQVNGHGTDARTDVYGLGLMLFEMCTGHTPFGGETEVATAMARLTTVAPSIRAERREVPAELDDLVHRCLARRPDARYASAGEVARGLERLRSAARSAPPTAAAAPGPSRATAVDRPSSRPEAQRPAPAPVAQPRPVSRSRRRSSGWIWALVAFVVVVALAVVAILLASDNSSSGGQNQGSGTAGSQAPITITQASAFDPFGDDHEDDGHTHQAFDANLATAWNTEQYNDPLQRTKQGVGLRLDLDRRATVHTVSVTTNAAGWSGGIYVANDPGHTLDSWGPERANGGDLGTTMVFKVAGVQGRSVLLWLTQLPNQGGKYQLGITEIQVA